MPGVFAEGWLTGNPPGSWMGGVPEIISGIAGRAFRRVGAARKAAGVREGCWRYFWRRNSNVGREAG